jgi:hypothetical protein
MSAPGPLPTVRRHPFLGLVGGLLLGSGLALFLVLFGVIAVGTWPPLLVPPLVALAGLAWGLWGPVRGGGRSSPPPVPTYNERVQQALADNETAIERGASTKAPERGRLLPGIGPPAAGSDTDWHRPHQEGSPGAGSDESR